MTEELEFVGDVGASELVPEVVEGKLRPASLAGSQPSAVSDQRDTDGEKAAR